MIVDSNKAAGPGWAVWFSGLPGSGKSFLAEAVYGDLRKRGLDVELLSMDRRRKAYFPQPTYSAEERAAAYDMFVDEALQLVERGKGVIMDGVCPKRRARERAAATIRRFAELQVRCTLETAMKREASRPEGLVMADLYRKALERKETGREFPGLGQVPGVDVPFEERDEAVRIDNERATKEEAVAQTLTIVKEILDRWGVESSAAEQP